MWKLLASAAAAVSVAAVSSPALGAQIILNDLGGVTPGSAAHTGFSVAAYFWGQRLSNNVTINLDVGFRELAPNVLGQAGSASSVTPIELVQGQLAATASSQIDAIAVANLPGLTAGQYGWGALDVTTSGYKLPTGQGVNTALRVLDNDGGANNSFLDANNANLKALGFTGFGDLADGSIEFSNQFKFDFNPMDGIDADAIDFVSVAVHEIGHVLGFVSGVDVYDFLGGPNGALSNDPTYGLLNLNDYAVASVLDLYRYSSGTGGTQLDWSVGGSSFFSIDGTSPLGGGYFSTGSYNGDGRQASHWKDNIPGQPQLGAMDPTVAFGQMGRVTSLDLAALDAIGWNIDYDVFRAGDRSFSTREIYASAVPEPSTWAMVIAGFVLSGGLLRRRRRSSFA